MIKISEFQTKDVVDVADGKRLGRVGDLELDLVEGRVRALVIPSGGRMFGLLPGGSDIVIPWENIVKIGIDVILVRTSLPSKTRSYADPDDRESVGKT
ncbi:MAG: YlmC/YmxH family sporulation protein [Hydrogenibacillus sp.]|nr:YlmC/YmxH family sporulation protein [Hydrogenibacillus sp.]